MTPCIFCDDTGSMSKSLDGDAQLDCAKCDIAIERAALNRFVQELKASAGPMSESELAWHIYLHGKGAE